jgi:3-deoxy-D-manno-octulosonate 8-phosphate phosphatase (KDO 8-P phosphatase)
MPSRLPSDVRRRLEPIRLLVLDVDGVLTDGGLLYGPEGELGKRFSVRDGLGIRLLLEAGTAVGVVSGRGGDATERRLLELGLDRRLVALGSRDKGADLSRVQVEAGQVTDAETAVMGDDLPDLPILMRAGFAACPADGAPDVAAVCHFVCGSKGGEGAAREVAELILKAQHRWSDVVRGWMGSRPAGSEGS